MSVLIQINGENAGEALKELAALAGPLTGGQAAVEGPKTDKPARSTRNTAKSETKVDPEPTKNDPTPEEPDAEQEEDEDDGTPIPSVVDLRAKAQEVGSSVEGGKTKVKALLDEFESKSISDIPEDKRTSFMKRLDALA